MTDRDNGCAQAPRAAVRVFVGVKLDPGIADDLAEMAQVLAAFQVRCVAAADMHLTLVPPWNETEPADAVEKLSAAVAGADGFSLTFTHVGYGPDPRRPRYLWVDCTESEDIAALRARLLAAFARTEERPFRPHVTLARLRDRGRTIARKCPIDRMLSLTQPVRSVELFQSPPAGESGYRVLASLRLDRNRQP